MLLISVKSDKKMEIMMLPVLIRGGVAALTAAWRFRSS
jgi:hypothetical protein